MSENSTSAEEQIRELIKVASKQILEGDVTNLAEVVKKLVADTIAISGGQELDVAKLLNHRPTDNDYLWQVDNVLPRLKEIGKLFQDLWGKKVVRGNSIRLLIPFKISGEGFLARAMVVQIDRHRMGLTINFELGTNTRIISTSTEWALGDHIRLPHLNFHRWTMPCPYRPASGESVADYFAENQSAQLAATAEILEEICERMRKGEVDE